MDSYLLPDCFSAKCSPVVVEDIEASLLRRLWNVTVDIRLKELENFCPSALPVTWGTDRLAIIESQRIGKCIGANLRLLVVGRRTLGGGAYADQNGTESN